MGFSVSWVAFKDMDKTEVLRLLKFVDLGHAVMPFDAALSLAGLPSGWTILAADDFDFGAAEHLQELSREGTTLACQAEEHVMFSAAHCYTRGREDWSLWHDGQRDIHHLSARGALPAQFATIRDRLIAEQDAHGGEKGGVDFIFDVPIELAATLTGYRHDRWKFDWGTPQFTAVQRAD